MMFHDISKISKYHFRYKNSLYLDPTNIDISLFENSEIVYKNTDEIRKYGRILKK